MNAIIFLIILGIVVAGGFVVAFIWAVRNGQYDDDYTPSVRMLFDPKTNMDKDLTQLTSESETELKHNNNNQ